MDIHIRNDSPQYIPDLDIAGGEDALGLIHHPLQPVLIDGVEQVNDGSLLEAELLLTATFKCK